MAKPVGRRAFAVGFALVALAGVFWGIGPQDAVHTGLWVGAATGLLNLLMLWLRRGSIVQESLARAVLGMQTNFFARMTVLVLVLLMLQSRLGTSGDMAFLGGFFMVEAAVVVLYVKEQG